MKEGEVAEWSKANDSKSFNRKLFVGSNPTLSVFLYRLNVVRDSQIVQNDWYHREKSVICLVKHTQTISQII